MNYYDITPGQNLLVYCQNLSIHKQVNNIFILMLAKKQLEPDKLRAAVETAYGRNECLRMRITKKSGKPMQYFPETETPKIEKLDFSGRKPKQMERTLSRIARRPIRMFNRPLTRVYLVTSPDRQRGIYFGVNHIILDAWGIYAALQQIMEVYQALETGEPLPKPLSPPEPLLRQELAYAGSPKHEKDREFWRNEFLSKGEPLFSHINGTQVLEKCRKRHRNPVMRFDNTMPLSTASKNEAIEVPADTVKQIESYCKKQGLPMQSVFMMGLRTAMSKLNNGQDDIYFMGAIARRGTLQEKRAGGSRAQSLPFRTVFGEETMFGEACAAFATVQSAYYRHADIDIMELLQIEADVYGRKGAFSSYNSLLFTFQPVPMALGDGTPLYTRWYSSGAFTTPFYLFVMDAGCTGALRCCYEYQYRNIPAERIRLLHSLMIRAIQMGVENPSSTIKEILNGLDKEPADKPIMEELPKAAGSRR